MRRSAPIFGQSCAYHLRKSGQGVDRTIEILSSEIRRTMKLLGVSTLDELEPGHVTQLARLVPLAQPAADAVAAAPARVATARALQLPKA